MCSELIASRVSCMLVHVAPRTDLCTAKQRYQTEGELQRCGVILHGDKSSFPVSAITANGVCTPLCYITRSWQSKIPPPPPISLSVDLWLTRYITGLNTEASFPAVGSLLDGLLNRTALMDVPFRGMQRQGELIYLAALDDPSLPDDPNTSVATQVYPAFDMLEAGFSTFDEVTLHDARRVSLGD